jgi:hypothetical protein
MHRRVEWAAPLCYPTPDRRQSDGAFPGAGPGRVRVGAWRNPCKCIGTRKNRRMASKKPFVVPA